MRAVVLNCGTQCWYNCEQRNKNFIGGTVWTYMTF